jgi:hypothetical protein
MVIAFLLAARPIAVGPFTWRRKLFRAADAA